ncbi:MAG: NAD(P)-dependent oxidoreductase, partial [Halieaceae bacterium]|nr:NAD(P)-dependent oxidoreductase [Halieaceae bacterium]
KGIFGPLMREYVTAYLLHFSRAVDAFHPRIGTPNTQRPIRWDPPAVDTLQGKCVGVLGAGSIASSLIDVARCFNFKIIGLTRSGQSEADFDALYSEDERLAMASACDYLVSLLPDTNATRHFIDAELLAALPSHCVLINAGRGATVDDDALLAALDNGQLKAAVLDVFNEEPLPSDHPYWHHPRVWVTQHTAALSDPKDVTGVFAENYRRWISGDTLVYRIDFDRGY